MREIPEEAAAGRISTLRENEGRNLSEAIRYFEQSQRAARDHALRIRSLEPIYGPALRAAVEEHLERLTESSSEAVHYFRLVIEALDGERSELRAETVHLGARLTNLEHELDRVRELPEIVLERAETYFRMTRRARPKWLADLRKALRSPAPAPELEEPF